MNDLEIYQAFKKLNKTDLTESHARLIKGLRSWYRKTGGLSQRQIELLKRIEHESQTARV